MGTSQPELIYTFQVSISLYILVMLVLAVVPTPLAKDAKQARGPCDPDRSAYFHLICAAMVFICNIIVCEACRGFQVKIWHVTCISYSTESLGNVVSLRNCCTLSTASHMRIFVLALRT